MCDIKAAQRAADGMQGVGVKLWSLMMMCLCPRWQWKAGLGGQGGHTNGAWELQPGSGAIHRAWTQWEVNTAASKVPLLGDCKELDLKNTEIVFLLLSLFPPFSLAAGEGM